MNQNNQNSQLLRNNINEMFEIIECEIIIDVNDDLKTAVYTYAYRVKKITDVVNEIWREVFAYPEDEFHAIGAYPGWPQADNGRHKNNGLGWEVNHLSTEDNIAVLTFPISLSKDDNDIYTFHYVCETKIESLNNIKWFGGIGIIWYWTAQEFKCKDIRLKLKLPKKVDVINSHPESKKDENGYFIFKEKNLLPMQFVSCLANFEKRQFGIPPKYAPFIDRLAMLISGGLISWGLTLLN